MKSKQPHSALQLVKQLFLLSSGADQFRLLLLRSGFQFVQEDFFGAEFKDPNCRLVYVVMDSHGRDKIFALDVKEGDGPSVSLIEKGRCIF